MATVAEKAPDGDAKMKAYMRAWKEWHTGWNAHCSDCGHPRAHHKPEAPHECEECGMFAHGCRGYRGEGKEGPNSHIGPNF